MSEFARLSHITKCFGPVKALEAVSTSFHAAEVHALMGENGAGKSTLMKILSGVYPYGDYSGEIQINSDIARFRSPSDAEAAGVAIIHQELSAFQHLSIAENLFVGHWPTRGGLNSLVNWEELTTNAKNALDKLGLRVDLSDKMSSLSTGNQQLVEIAKALSKKAKLLIFDEPTSSLTPNESERLFAIIDELRAQGLAIVYISHRMEEIRRLCDRISILRDGKSIHTGLLQDLTDDEIIRYMVGRELSHTVRGSSNLSANRIPAMKVEQVMVHDLQTQKQIGPIDFVVNQGEILGFSGLLGSGRSELFKALLGYERFQRSGSLIFFGQEVRWSSPLEAYRDGVGFISEDRKLESILTTRSLDENAAITRLSLKGLVGVLRPESELAKSKTSLQKIGTKFSDVLQRITELSGGNQQKVIFARILENSPKLLILDEPTRGVDVGAKQEIYQLLNELTAAGTAIILISSDLPELIALSDSVVVMNEGRMKGLLRDKEISEDRIMQTALKEV